MIVTKIAFLAVAFLFGIFFTLWTIATCSDKEYYDILAQINYCRETYQTRHKRKL
jgi:hypothetical protein